MLFGKNLRTALLSSTALVGAASFASAAELSGPTDLSGGFVAPLTLAQVRSAVGTAITPALGKGLKFRITAGPTSPTAPFAANTGLAAAAGGTASLLTGGAPKFYPFYFDSAGAFLFTGAAVTDASQGTPSGVADGIEANILLTTNAAASSVAFVVVAGASDSIRSAPAVLATANTGVIDSIKASVTQQPRGVKFDTVALDLTSTYAAITSTEADAAAAKITAAQKLPLVTTYIGPTLTRANKPTDAADTVQVTIFTSHPTNIVTPSFTAPAVAAVPALVVGTTDVKPDLKFVTTAGTETTSATTKVNPAGAFQDLLGGEFFTVRGAGDTPFVGILASVATKVPAVPAITDLAGNGLAFPSSQTLVLFAKPTYAATGAAKAIANVVTTDSEANRALLFGAGLKSTASASVKAVLRFNEQVDAATCDVTDFAVVPTPGLGVTAATCAAAVATLTLSDPVPADADLWTVAADGKLSFAGTPVTVEAKFSATTPLKTIAPGSQAFVAGDTAGVTNVFIGVAQAPTLATRDNNIDGLVDGSTIDFKHAVGTPALADLKVQTAFGGTARDITFSATKLTGDTKVAITFASPATADWSENGTGAEAADAALYVAKDFNTGVAGATVKYTSALAAARTLKYAGVFDAVSGDAALVGAVPPTLTGLPALHTDGASPVVTAVTWSKTESAPVGAGAPAPGVSGTVAVDASESLAGGPADPAQYLFNNAPLNLLGLNASPALTVLFGALATPTGGVANSRFTFTSTPDVTGTILKITDTPGLTDAVANKLATDGTKTVTLGAQINASPQIVEAIAIRDGAGIRTNISKLLVRFSKPVQLALAGFTGAGTPAGVLVDGLFKVRGTDGTTAFEVSIPGAATNVDLSGAATSGQVILTVPSPGLPAATTSVVVEYDAGAGNNILTSTETTGAVAAANVGTFNGVGLTAGNIIASVDDADTRRASVPSNSTKLHTMEISGTVTKGRDGVAPKPGTIVQANVVGIIADVIAGPNAQCTSLGDAQTPVTVRPALTLDGRRAIRDARRAGQNTAVLGAAGLPAGCLLGPKGSGGRDIELSLTTGALSNAGGASGGTPLSGRLDIQRVLDIVSDASFRVLDVGSTGGFRMAIGTDETPDNAFVVIAVKEPDNANWIQATSGDPGAANFVSFNANNVSAGPSTIQAVPPIDLTKIKLSRVATGANTWRLVRLFGEPDRRTLTGNPRWNIGGFFVTVDQATGLPFSIIDDEVVAAPFGMPLGNDRDEVFGMEGNAVRSYIELNAQVAVNTILSNDIIGGRALAHRQSVGPQVAIHRNVHYAVRSNDPAPRRLDAGWSLITIAGAGDPNNLPAAITAVLEVDSTNQARTFFRGAAAGTNTLTALVAGDPYFVFAASAVSSFNFKP
ncbi:MAG: hypothetical protein ACT4P2_17435 [Pseudomonadota bacterium]